jgi:hypothetical protein
VSLPPPATRHRQEGQWRGWVRGPVLWACATTTKRDLAGGGGRKFPRTESVG